MAGLIAAEWVKLRSVRSTYWIGLAVLVVIALLGAFILYAADLWDGLPAARRATLRVANIELQLQLPLQICGAVLAVLAVTAEHTTRQIRTSLTVTPGRVRFLAAKALVVGVVVVLAAEAATLGTYLMARLVVGDRTMRDYQAPAADVLPGLALGAVSVLVVTLAAFALAVLLRSTPAAIVGAVVLVFVLPRLATALPEPWNIRVFTVLPEHLGLFLTGSPSDPGVLFGDADPGFTLTVPLALGLLAAYAIVPLAAAAVAFHRRDP